MVWFLIVGNELAALRYMAVTRPPFCYLPWFPVRPFEIFVGAINLIIAAAIVAGVSGHAWLAIAGTLAKLSPLLATDPRLWRRYLVPMSVFLAITIPWLWLWPA